MPSLLPLFHRFLSILILSLAGSASTLSAQVEVVGSGKPRVGIVPSGSKGKDAAAVLKADLERTMLIEVVPQEKAQFVVTLEAETQGLKAELTGAPIKFSSPKLWRMATHELADEITRQTTGFSGIAQTQVAFISAESGKKELYVMDIDGHNLRQRTSDNSISNSPSWHPNGQRVTYTSYKSGYPDVYMIDLVAGTRTKIAAFPGYNSGARFSRDGQNISLTLSKDGNPEIYMISADGGVPLRLTRTTGVETSPSWSPDNKRIVYSSDDRGAPQLFVVNVEPGAADFGKTEPISVSLPWNAEPDWSPDGTKFTFTTRRLGKQEIGVHEIDTGNSSIVSKNGGEDSVWLSNSRHLAFVRDGKLYLLDSITRQETALSTTVGQVTEPAVTTY